MVDYEFYVNCYLGSAIPEKSFPGMAAQAAAVLERLEGCCRVSGGEEARKLAVCAMAESLYSHARRAGGLTSASVGSVSVRYEDTGTNLNRELYQKASIYLDIYRGVGG